MKSNEKWKKARVASVSKAHTEIMEAMADSHSAEMAVMNDVLEDDKIKDESNQQDSDNDGEQNQSESE